MPRYLPRDVLYTYGPGSAAKRPKLAPMIGTIAADWAYVEHLIGDSYALLLGWDMPPSEELEPSLELHHVGIQIFDCLPALKQRVELLTKLVKTTMSADEHRSLVQTIVPCIEKGSRARNRVVHSVWGTTDRYPEDLIRLPADSKPELYGTKEFGGETALVGAAHGAMSDFFSHAHAMRLASQRKRYPRKT